ncbi:MAG: hypothetical protein WCA11_14210 [Terracidiphilus sp.]
MEVRDEQAVARTEQDAAKGNAGAENPLAPRTPNTLRMPGSAEEPAALPEDQSIEN